MPTYTFVPLDEAGLAGLSSWFVDAELRRPVQPPTPQWFDFVRNTPGCYAWLVHSEDGPPIGFIQLDTMADQRASIALVVRPEQRRQGYGRAILRALLDHTAVAEIGEIEARIEPDNVASLRCFTAAGFIQERAEPDAEGFLRLVYRRPK